MLRFIGKIISLFFFLFFGNHNIASAFQLNIGDCPVYYQEPCKPENVKFILSTNDIKRSTTRYHYLDPFKPQLPKYFDKSKPLKMLIHGYGGLTYDYATTNVSKAYEELHYNIILVDWETLSSLPCYLTSYLNTWHVAQCVEILVLSLVPLGLDPKSMHVIGFSLGAHVAGLAGSNLKKSLGRSFHRITGLDPALPFFATLKNDWKLDESDAFFVDIVHTSAGSFGKIEASGHADFYMNGGSLQPYCYKSPYPPICSHVMAGLYFAESIRGRNKSNQFVGHKCDNVASYALGFCASGKTAVMGEYTPVTTRGSYFMDTSDKPPFALGYRMFQYSYDILI